MLVFLARAGGVGELDTLSQGVRSLWCQGDRVVPLVRPEVFLGVRVVVIVSLRGGDEHFFETVVSIFQLWQNTVSPCYKDGSSNGGSHSQPALRRILTYVASVIRGAFGLPFLNLTFLIHVMRRVT